MNSEFPPSETDALEAALRARLRAGTEDAPPDFADVVVAQLPATNGRSILLWCAAAAVALIVGGLAWKFQPATSETRNAAPPAVVASAANEFAVLNCNPEAGQVLWLDYDDFSLHRTAVGESVKSIQVNTVSAHGFGGTDTAGVSCAVDTVTHNLAAAKKLDAEVRALASLRDTGGLGGDHLRRLGVIAGSGHPEALRVLLALADAEGPWSEAAAAAVVSQKDLVSVRKLIVEAQRGEPQFRRQMIRGLARIQSPLTINALRDLCADPDTDIAAFALEQLCGIDGAGALQALHALSVSDTAPDLRARAAAEYKQRLHEDTGHEN